MTELAVKQAAPVDRRASPAGTGKQDVESDCDTAERSNLSRADSSSSQDGRQIEQHFSAPSQQQQSVRNIKDPGSGVIVQHSISSRPSSPTTSQPPWGNHKAPSLISSEKWNIHPPLTTNRQHCSGGPDNALLPTPPDISGIRHPSDGWNQPQNTLFGGRHFGLPSNASSQIRAFERFPQSLQNPDHRHHIMDGGTESSPFPGSEDLSIHQTRLEPYSTVPQHAASTGRLPVGMQSNFPRDDSPLDSRAGGSPTDQSKTFPLSPPAQSHPHRSSLAYSSHHVMHGIATPTHGPQTHSNISLSSTYGLGSSASRLHPHPSGRDGTARPPLIDPRLPQPSGSHEDVSVHQFYATRGESHHRLPAQVAQGITGPFSSGLHQHDYDQSLPVHNGPVGTSQSMGYMPTDIGLQQTDEYGQQRRASVQMGNYSQGTLSFGQPVLHPQDAIAARPVQLRTASSDSSSQDYTAKGDGEQSIIELDLAYDVDAQEPSYLKIPKKSRAAFTEYARRETGETRKTGACIRCRFQRSRCKPALGAPNGECQTCRDVQKESKKVVHRLPCLRWKLTDIVLSRMDTGPLGSLSLTQRWQGFTLRDVSEWVDEETRTIDITLGICPIPLVLHVRKFKPKAGDITYRSWRDGNAERRMEIEPFALASIRQTSQHFKEYLNKNILKALEIVAQDQNNDELIRETFQWAMRQYQNLRVDGLTERQQPEEWQFLADVLRLWMAIKHTVGSSYICGIDKLGMEPKTDDQSYPLFGRVSTPRMIVAQNDSINASDIIMPLRRRVLKHLESHFKANKPRSWFTLYLAVFVFLHSASVISADRRRHGRENGAQKGYSLPRFVEELHVGANVLLAYWHYYRTDEDPLEVDCLDRHRSRLMDLTAEQFTFVQKSCKKMREKREAFMGATNWDDQLYWVCRMFDQEWEASDTFAS